MDIVLSDEKILKLKKIVLIIIEKKKENKKLNRYEYYMLGGIPFKKAETILYKLHKDGKLSMSEFNTLFTYIAGELLLGVSKNKDFILNTHYQYGDKIITAEEKQNIWSELNAYGLSDNEIDDLVFSGAVKEYAKINGYISSKKLVKQSKGRGE